MARRRLIAIARTSRVQTAARSKSDFQKHDDGRVMSISPFASEPRFDAFTNENHAHVASSE